MLCEITIENVAVIEKATATFENGFTVLTGETGAGKSILIDSINAIMGSRTSKDVVRSGTDKAKIWATFRNLPIGARSAVSQAGYTLEDELLLYREISVDGKSSCRINGAPATATILREVCESIISIHGQHDNQSLLNPAHHIDMLDNFARNSGMRETYSKFYTEYLEIEKAIGAQSIDEIEKKRKLELLHYAINEIDTAELKSGEEENLLKKRDTVNNAQSILQNLNAAYIALSGDENDSEGAATLVGSAAAALHEASRHAADVEPIAEAINEAYYSIKEAASDIQNALDRYDSGGFSLDEIEQRLDLLYRLKNKYGGTVESTIDYSEAAKKEIDSIEFVEERLAKLLVHKKENSQQLKKVAEELSQNRQAAFNEMNGRILKALEFLNMSNIALTLQKTVVAYNSKGIDEVEFYISTNLGERPKPLAKIASGGELARIMLALKSVLADRDDLGTVIYDEIDTGVSGLAAGRIGHLLKITGSGGRQVICVTHTAQVASYAAHHLLIEKTVQSGRTFTKIRQLDKDERIQELARIISGDKVTNISLANAHEMLNNAETIK